MSNTVSFAGLDPIAVIHALHAATSAPPNAAGRFWPGASRPPTLEQVRDDFDGAKHGSRAYQSGEYLDYYRGRPMKLRLDLEAETVDVELYERDAGAGAASRAISRLRAESSDS